ncbi:hypothetical protein CHUAL_010476 [Chamberlinius hualienensis]
MVQSRHQSIDGKYGLRQLPTSLEIHLHNEKFAVDNLWLRVHCRCPKCYHAKTHQRELTFLDASSDVSPLNTTIDGTGRLTVNWSDGHDSSYDISWIKNNLSLSQKLSPKLWSSDDWRSTSYPAVDYNKEINDNQFASQVLRHLLTYGFCFVNQAPSNVGDCEMVIRKIAPVQKTFWGEMWTLTSNETEGKLDTSFSNSSLPPHTDSTYFSDAPGLQVFSCLKLPESGGETILVDGFYAANCLQVKDPLAYRCLTTVPIDSTYQDDLGNYYIHNDYVIKQCVNTGFIFQIRFNPLDIGIIKDISPQTFRQFYQGYNLLAKEILNPKNRILTQLVPGSILFVDNWRVLHGRMSFVGERQLCGCYISRGDYISRGKLLGLL